MAYDDPLNVSTAATWTTICTECQHRRMRTIPCPNIAATMTHTIHTCRECPHILINTTIIPMVATMCPTIETTRRCTAMMVSKRSPNQPNYLNH